MIFFIVYNFITVKAVNRKIYETNKNIASFYQNTLESDLKKVELNLAELVANNHNYRQLLNKSSEYDVHISSYNIIEEYKTMLKLYPQITGLYIYSPKNDLYRSTYNEGYKYQQKVEIEEYLKSMVDYEERSIKTSWNFEKINDHYYIVCVLGVKETYVMCSIEVDQMLMSVEIDGFLVFYSEDGSPLTMESHIMENEIILEAEKEDFYITGTKNNYFIVQSEVSFDNTMRLAYISPYSGIWDVMERAQIYLILASVMILCLIPICHRLLLYYFIRPLEELVNTMNQIKQGEIETKMLTDYNVTEFCQTSETFNEMMDEIKNLKILAYERMMEVQRVELQYLQIQIRPHFFLNCLKNLYGLAEEGKTKEVQEMIMLISHHSRYTFRDSFDLVPVETEMNVAENYIQLQKLSLSFSINYECNIQPELRQLRIPQMSILTFIENSVKHGVRLHQELKIFVKVQRLVSSDEDYINITISDNGKGFSEEVLMRINGDKYENASRKGEHIGIFNVKQRMALIYQGRETISFMNHTNGACIEIFIPYEIAHKV